MSSERYRIVQRLAVGGMAEIFLALPTFGEATAPVVLKRAREELGPDALRLLVREGELTQRLAAPQLVKLLEVAQVGGDGCLVFELVEGETLQRLQAARGGTPLVPSLSAYIAREVALGLSAAHSHSDSEGRPLPIVHGDVTPSNVMIGKTGLVKLGDFGIAEVARGAPRPGALRGKAGWLAPEQLARAPLDPRSDLFNLGLLLYWLLTGKRLFDTADDAEARSRLQKFRVRELVLPEEVPNELAEVLRSLLQPDPAKRPQAAHEVAEALHPVCLTVRKMDVRMLFQKALPGWKSPWELAQQAEEATEPRLDVETMPVLAVAHAAAAYAMAQAAMPVGKRETTALELPLDELAMLPSDSDRAAPPIADLMLGGEPSRPRAPTPQRPLTVTPPMRESNPLTTSGKFTVPLPRSAPLPGRGVTPSPPSPAPLAPLAPNRGPTPPSRAHTPAGPPTPPAEPVPPRPTSSFRGPPPVPPSEPVPPPRPTTGVRPPPPPPGSSAPPTLSMPPADPPQRPTSGIRAAPPASPSEPPLPIPQRPTSSIRPPPPPQGSRESLESRVAKELSQLRLEGRPPPTLDGIDLAAVSPSRELLLRLPRAWAERLQALVIGAEGSTLVVALADAEPPRTVASIKAASGCAGVRTFQATDPAALEAAIARAYDQHGLKRQPLLGSGR